MGREPRRVDAEATEVADRIIRSAVIVMGRKGFHETRIADVATEAGVSPALVIYYFGQRRTLLAAALRHTEDAYYESIVDRTRSIESPRERLRELIRHSLLADAESPAYSVLWHDMLAMSLRHSDIAKDRKELDERWRTTLHAIIEEGIACGEFAAVDAADTAVLIASVLDGLAAQVALGDPHVSQDSATRIALGLCDTLLPAQRTARRRLA